MSSVIIAKFFSFIVFIHYKVTKNFANYQIFNELYFIELTLIMEQEITLRDVANYLDNIGIQFLATIGLDGKPKVRPMQYMVLEDEKLWFCTNSKKEIFAELQANPCIELCGCKLEKNEMQTPWIRFSAEAVFEERQDIRDAIIDKSAIVNALYKTMRDNPIFKVFYLKNIDGWMTNLGHVKGLENKDEFARPIHFKF